MGEVVLFIVIVLSVPVINAISRGNRGEFSGDCKINLIWPICVAFGFAYFITDDFGSLIIDAIGGTMIGVAAIAVAIHYLDGKVKEKQDAQKELERKEAEIQELRDEIRKKEND